MSETFLCHVCNTDLHVKIPYCIITVHYKQPCNSGKVFAKFVTGNAGLEPIIAFSICSCGDSCTKVFMDDIKNLDAAETMVTEIEIEYHYKGIMTKIKRKVH